MANKKRILLFGWLPPPVFGPSVAYQALLRSDFPKHFDVTFINLSVVPNIRELEQFRIRKLLKLAQFLALELWYLLTRRFALVCYPISFNRNAFLKDTVLLGLARAFGVPTVLWAHGTGVARFRETLSPRLRTRFDQMVRRSRGVLVLAECLREEFGNLLPLERIRAVTLGIEPAPTDTRHPDGRTILYVGTLLKAKGIFDLLEAFPTVRARVPEARLVVAGEWFRADEEQATLEWCRRHHLTEAVRFVGPVWGEAKWALLRSADVFVFPPHSRSEAFGLVLLEAMQAGVPVVTTRGGARNEMVADGVTGLLAEEQNPSDLAAKILQLLTDPLLRERMGRAGRERFLSHYTHEHYGRRMIEALEAFTSEPPDPLPNHNS